MVDAVSAVLAGAPDWLVFLFALLTQLGDPWFVFVTMTLGYWLGTDRLSSRPRRAGATLIAIGLSALAVTVALKSTFALPRPPGADEAFPPTWLPPVLASMFVDMATGDGFGFPSGHALGSTAIYGGMAVLADRLWTRRRRLLVAGALVCTVALSRLVIGVHVLADVSAGVLAGVAVLWLVLRVSDDGGRPFRAYLLASGLSLVAIAVTVVAAHPGELFEATFAFGSAVGGGVGWHLFDERIRVSPRTAAVALFACGGLWGAIYTLEPALLVTAVGSAVALGSIVAVPGLAGRLAMRT